MYKRQLQTTDQKEIKKAYAARVKSCHREEKPEEWAVLHDAYQRAIQYAKRQEKESDLNGSRTVPSPVKPVAREGLKERDAALEKENGQPETCLLYTSRLNMFKEDYKDYKIINTQEHMDLVADCAAQMGLFPYYLYRQKGMAGNLENVGYAKEGMAGVYNVLIMEEKQTIVACGAGASTKRVWTEPNPDGTHRIERAENVKDVAQYIARIDEMIQRKQKLFAEE